MACVLFQPSASLSIIYINSCNIKCVVITVLLLLLLLLLPRQGAAVKQSQQDGRDRRQTVGYVCNDKKRQALKGEMRHDNYKRMMEWCEIIINDTSDEFNVPA